MYGIKGRRFVVLFRCKLNQFGVIEAYLSNFTATDFSAFYLQDDGEKKAGIDMKQNYVNVTLSIGLGNFNDSQGPL